MARTVTYEHQVAATSQFTGNEFSIGPSRQDTVLVLLEVDLQMGTESKTWQIQKTLNNGASVCRILRSVDASTGAPAATTDDSVIATFADLGQIFEKGDGVQILTTSATSQMYAKFFFLELDPAELLQFSSGA